MLNKSQKFQYNSQFLNKIIVSILTDQKFLLRAMELQVDTYIDSQPHEWFVKFIFDFYKTYHVMPTMESIKIKIQQVKEPLFKQSLSSTFVAVLNTFQQNNLEFVKDRVINFCRFQQLKKAITKSIDLLQEENFQQIYDLINKTRYKGLQPDFGVQYVSSFEDRYTQESLSWIETPWSVINNVLRGGLRQTKLGIILSPPGCVTEDTEIQVKIFDDNNSKIMMVNVGQVKKLLDQGKRIEVKTLNGEYTNITNYIEKGTLDTFLVSTQNYFIKVSNDHLFFSRAKGWIKTRHLNIGQFILCNDQIYQKVINIEYIGKEKIVDITVDHPEHCYYGNGILNHNSGKSWILCNLAAYAIKLGKKVVYYTLEMAKQEIGSRIDSILARKPVQYIEIKSNWDKIKSIIQPYRDNLRIKQFLPDTTRVIDIQNHMNQLIIFEKFDPDLIVVDYGDILKKESNINDLYSAYGDVYTNLKRLAKQYRKVVWTGAQGRRSSLSSQFVLGDDIAHSLGKLEIADFVLSMSRKQEDKMSNTARFVVVKNRGGRDGNVYNAIVDFDIGSIQIFDNYTKNSIEARQKMDNNDALLKQSVRERLQIIRKQKQQQEKQK